MITNQTQSINGLLIVDKPFGWTSHDVCHFVRKRFAISKVGHAGILDRTATGVLVLLLGCYTKLSSRFLNEPKEYEGTLQLGAKTTTHDAAGEIVQRSPWEHVEKNRIREVVAGFQGQREQLPPMASAVKRGGVRLYKLARQGKEIDRPCKTIHIYEMTIKSFSLPCIDFYCKVSKGTYVRTMANDIGEELGTFAHLKCLRRIASGAFHIKDSLTVEGLKLLKSPEALRPYLCSFSPKETLFPESARHQE